MKNKMLFYLPYPVEFLSQLSFASLLKIFQLMFDEYEINAELYLSTEADFHFALFELIGSFSFLIL